MKRVLCCVLAMVLLMGMLPALAEVDGREIFSYQVGKLDGIGFSPYIKNQSAEDQWLVVGEEQIRERLGIIAPHTQRIRTFGCDKGLELIPRIAHEEFGLGVCVGLWVNEDPANNELQIENAVKAAPYAEMFVFSETLNLGFSSADTLIGCIDALRARLRDAGHGDLPIAISEPQRTIREQGLDVLRHVDVMGINYHPTYDGTTAAEAGKRWLPEQLDSAKELADQYGVGLMVGETGFSSYAAGGDEEAARLSAAVYNMWAIYQCRQKGVLLYSFTGFDESWKTKYGSLEAHFGFWDQGGALKYAELFQGSDQVIMTPPSLPREADTPSGAENPSLVIDEWPGDDNGFRVVGRVAGTADPSRYRVMVWISVDSEKWVKPSWDAAVQFVDPSSGAFSIAATTPGAANDVNQEACYVLLLPDSADPDIHDYEQAAKDALYVVSNER